MDDLSSALAASVGVNASEYFVIDNDLRTISIPNSMKIAGVENDDDINRIPFRMPRYVKDTDLSEFQIRINYTNALGEGDLYMVTDKTVEEDTITFSWLLDRHAFASKGEITFTVCARLIVEGNLVDKEYNTTIHKLTVLQGLETDKAVPIDVQDHFLDWLQEEADHQLTAIQSKGTEVLNSIPADYTDLTEDVVDLKSAIDAIAGQKNYTEGFRLDRNGNLVEDANCCVSDFIPLTAGTNADFYTGVSSTTLIFILYQADKTTIVEWYGVTNTEHRDINPLLPGTAYVRMTFLAGYNGKIIKTGDAATVYYDSSVRTDGEIDEINANISAIESEQTEIKSRLTALENEEGYANYTEGYWLDWHGYLLENDAYCLSERVYIPGGTAIRFWCGASTDSICLVEYAEDGTQIATWGNINQEYRDIVTLTASTAFVRLSFVKGYPAKIGLANTPYVSSIVYYEANSNIGGDIEKVPDYYFENLYLQNKVAFVNRLLRGCAANGDGFIFVTDAHWGLNAKKSPSLIDYIAKRTTIDKVFDGGDRYDGYWPEPSRQFMKAIGTQKFYPVVGNHEFLYDSTNSDAFASAFMHLGNSIVWGNPREFYYYFDNPEQKIRYICLQSFYENAAHDGSGAVPQYSSDELTWFENVALNVQSGWTILIFTHCAITGNDATKTATIPTSGSYGQLISIIENYSGNGEIACIIQGHFHWDYMTQLPTSGVPVVVTTCDKYDFYNEPALTDEQRTPGTIDEQAFDVVILDKANRKLTFVRIGDKAVLNGGDGSEVEYREVTY